MNNLDPQRKKVVVLCAAVACMAGVVPALKQHPTIQAVWIALEMVAVVFAIHQFMKWKRQSR